MGCEALDEATQKSLINSASHIIPLNPIAKETELVVTLHQSLNPYPSHFVVCVVHILYKLLEKRKSYTAQIIVVCLGGMLTQKLLSEKTVSLLLVGPVGKIFWAMETESGSFVRVPAMVYQRWCADD
jgi:adenosyl cobinamide kinase/adenosyl cobinamide phosphate guanylyltransferase